MLLWVALSTTWQLHDYFRKVKGFLLELTSNRMLKDSLSREDILKNDTDYLAI